MKTPCLECAHLAPIKRIPKGHPLEIQVGQQGMLARGLAQCTLCLPGEKYTRFRYINATSPCRDFQRITDKDRIANRKALADRLQKDFAKWMESRRKK